MVDGFDLKRFGKGGDARKQFGVAGAAGQPNYGDAGVVRRFKTQRIGKVEVKSNETTLFCMADLN